MTIQIEHDEQTIRVESPYSAEFVERARALGGRWDRAARVWTFDAEAEEAVRKALRDAFGTAGDDAEPTTTLYVYATNDRATTRGPVRLVEGIELARAFSRDSDARMAQNVAHLRGDRPESGGSRANWETRIPAGCLLAVYDVRRGLADRALAATDWVVLEGSAAEDPDAILRRARAIAAERALPGALGMLRRSIAARHQQGVLTRDERRQAVRRWAQHVRALREQVALGGAVE
jgi:hypothetical protein